MKGRQAILDRVDGRAAAALLVDGQLDDLLIDAPDDGPPRPGAIYRATADRAMKGQGGLMVRLGDGLKGFLRQGGGIRPGAARLVQVTGYAEPSKAVPVTGKLVFKGRHVLVTPGAPGVNLSRQIKDGEERVRLLDAVDRFSDIPDLGIIVRSGAAGAELEELVDETEDLIALASAILEDADGAPELLLDGPDAHALAWREWGDVDQVDEGADAFARHGVDEMIAAVRAPRVPLGGSGDAYVEPTRALVAVDVNTGGDTSPAAGLKANIALARALPRALRCKGLGGQITIDFAPMPKRDRKQVEQALGKAFRADPVETALVGWTPLGHFELQRKRERLPLV